MADGAHAIDVVAGIIFSADRERVLLALRKPEQHQGDRWEFPGGKLEADETAADGLTRELNEELGIRVSESVAFHSLTFSYPDKTVRLLFRSVFEFSGTPGGREGQQVQWFALDELKALPFPDANQEVVSLLLEQGIVHAGSPPAV